MMFIVEGVEVDSSVSQDSDRNSGALTLEVF